MIRKNIFLIMIVLLYATTEEFLSLREYREQYVLPVRLLLISRINLSNNISIKLPIDTAMRIFEYLDYAYSIWKDFELAKYNIKIQNIYNNGSSIFNHLHIDKIMEIMLNTINPNLPSDYVDIWEILRNDENFEYIEQLQRAAFNDGYTIKDISTGTCGILKDIIMSYTREEYLKKQIFLASYLNEFNMITEGEASCKDNFDINIYTEDFIDNSIVFICRGTNNINGAKMHIRDMILIFGNDIQLENETQSMKHVYE